MAGLSLSLLLVVGGLTWAVAKPDPYVATLPDSAPSEVEPGVATQRLQQLEDAVIAGDAAAAGDLAAAADQEARAALEALVDNAGALRIDDFTLRYVDERSGLTADGTWTAEVAATWRFGGFDEVSARDEVLVTFTADEGETTIDSVGGGDLRTPVWMSGPVQVRRSDTTLVYTAGDAERLDDYETYVEEAVPTVRRVVRGWDPRLVVEIPATPAGLDQALDAEPGEYGGIAAVTTTVDGSNSPRTPIHIFVNPTVFEALESTGAQVVMSHEVAHVATQAPNSSNPLWLIEGFADYVALRDVDLPIEVTAGQIIERVRADGVPATLPDRIEFDTAETHLGASYESAWLACVVLAEQGSEEALVAFYRAMDDGAELGPTLQRLFSWSERDLVAAWQDRLDDLAGLAGPNA